MTLFSSLCSKTEATVGNQIVYLIIKSFSLRKWLSLPTYSSYSVWSGLPSVSQYSFKVVHLVWNVVPVVVKAVDFAVGERQDNQVVTGPGRVQEDDDGSYDGHLQHRRPLPGLQRVAFHFNITLRQLANVACVKREKRLSPWIPGKCWPATSWRSCKDTGRARRRTAQRESRWWWPSPARWCASLQRTSSPAGRRLNSQLKTPGWWTGRAGTVAACVPGNEGREILATSRYFLSLQNLES